MARPAGEDIQVNTKLSAGDSKAEKGEKLVWGGRAFRYGRPESPSWACMMGMAPMQTRGTNRHGLRVSSRCIWPMLDGGKAPVPASDRGVAANERWDEQHRPVAVTH